MPLLAAAGPAAAHDAFGLSDPIVLGALTPAIFPETGAAMLALAAVAARAEGGMRDAAALTLAAALGLLGGALCLFFAHWGLWPGGVGAPLVAVGAGLLAMAPSSWRGALPRALQALLCLAGGAVLGLSVDLHAPLDFALRQALGAAGGGAAAMALAVLLMRLAPPGPRPAICATLGAWAAAVAILGLAFRLAMPAG